MCHILWHNPCMPSTTIRELRDTKRLKTWLRSGQTVELRERDVVIAHIVPEPLPDEHRVYPDFAALQKEIFGDRVLNAVDVFLEERGRY